jgi:hypothetical protein
VASIASKSDLLALYNAYLSLVTTANESDAPLWAFSSATPWRADSIDPLHTKPYCDSLGLTPRQGPFVVITVHPPETIRRSDAKVLLGFGDQGATAIARSLIALADEAADKGLADAPAGSRGWWRAWEKLSVWARRRLAGTTMIVEPKVADRR